MESIKCDIVYKEVILKLTSYKQQQVMRKEMVSMLSLLKWHAFTAILHTYKYNSFCNIVWKANLIKWMVFSHLYSVQKSCRIIL